MTSTAAAPASTSAMPDKQAVIQAMATLPLLLVQGSRQPLPAQAIVCALLLQHPDYEAAQLKLIKEQGSLALLQQVDQVVDAVQALSLPLQVQLLQRTIPALKALSHDHFLQFEQLMLALTAVDKQLSLLEWIVIHFIDHTVASHFKPKPQVRGHRQTDFAALQVPTLQLLAAVANTAGEAAACQQAWQAGLHSLGLSDDTAMPDSNWSSLSAQLDNLLGAAPLLKQQIWQAMLAAVAADQQQTSAEQALLTALALLLEMPWQPEPLAS